MPNQDEIRADIAAFTDEDGDVLIDVDGTIIYRRNGEEYVCRLVVAGDGSLRVDIGHQTISYRRFLMHELARLDVFAQRLLSHRSASEFFVDGPASLDTVEDGTAEGNQIELLNSACTSSSPFASRLLFVTADAGQGKTRLLREYQTNTASRFLEGNSPFLFWHVDLQGRQLLRLSEALMGDLGDLRVAGLYMSGILTLIRHKALVVAVDGFDELAAEQGGTDAVGALAVLVQQLNGLGTIVAASRRTFFNTENYLRRGAVMKRAIASPSQFDQLRLGSWARNNVEEFFGGYQLDGKTIPNPSATYDDLATALGGDTNHPMITRPFLVSQIARGIVLYNKPPGEFLNRDVDPLEGVADVVKAFIQREVAEKWVFRDTGEPLLTVEQHLEFLGHVAEEMYLSHRDRLDLEIIEAVIAVLLDQWNVDPSRRQQVMEMVKMHVLLVVPPDGNARARAFDHPEFRDYFVAQALGQQLDRIAQGRPLRGPSAFLSVGQITDSAASFVLRTKAFTQEELDRVILGLAECVREEWKATYLQVNVGTILPALLRGRTNAGTIAIDCPAVMSSVVLEGSSLSEVTLSDCIFINVSLRDINWSNVTLERCSLGDLEIWSETLALQNVRLVNCDIESVTVRESEDVVRREFDPLHISTTLAGLGFQSNEQETIPFDTAVGEGAATAMAKKILLQFRRSTVISTHRIKIRFSRDVAFVEEEILPIFAELDVVEEMVWSGKGHGRVWKMKELVDDVLSAQGKDPTETPLAEVWQRMAVIDQEKAPR